MPTKMESQSMVAPAPRTAPMPAADARVHPAADLFPDLSPAAYRALKADIKVNGVVEPIWLDPKGRVLDGRHRLRAAHELGKNCTTYVYDGADPLGFVVSLNLRRRHLTDRQRAQLAAKLGTFSHGGARTEEKSKSPTGDLQRTQAEAAQLMNVSKRSVERAAARLKGGSAAARPPQATAPQPTIEPKAIVQTPPLASKNGTRVPEKTPAPRGSESVDLVARDSLVHVLVSAHTAFAGATAPSALEVDVRLTAILEGFRAVYPRERRLAFVGILERQLAHAKTSSEKTWSAPA